MTMQNKLQLVDAQGNPLGSGSSPLKAELMGSLVMEDGQTSVTTTATAVGDQGGSEISLQADPSNTENILVGSASSQHTVLQPGQSMSLSIASLSLVYVVSVSGTQLLNWLVRG